MKIVCEKSIHSIHKTVGKEYPDDLMNTLLYRVPGDAICEWQWSDTTDDVHHMTIHMDHTFLTVAKYCTYSKAILST